MELLIKKIDKLWIGAIIGTLIPLIVLFVIYKEEKITDSFIIFLKDLFNNRLLSAFLRIGLIGNLAFFLLTFNTGFTYLPKGILMATIFYGLLIVYMFIW